MQTPLEVRLLTAKAVLPLRATVLRPGRALADAIFPGDDAPDTLHLGVFSDATLVGVASLYPRPAPFVADISAWQLRGMAIDPAAQRQSYGRALLLACMEQVALRGGTLLWCNARVGVVGFYQALGFETQGEEFVIPDVGPHYVCSRVVRRA